MIKEIYYLVIDFEYFTKECENVVIGICKKMGMDVKPRANGEYVVFSDDEEVIDYVKYLADCDMVRIVG